MLGFVMCSPIALVFAVLCQNLLVESAINIPPGKKIVHESAPAKEFKNTGTICIPATNKGWCNAFNLANATDPALCTASYTGVGSFSGSKNTGVCKEGGYCSLELTLPDPYSAEVVCVATNTGGAKCNCYVYGPE